jgi:hypothetical protein
MAVLDVAPDVPSAPIRAFLICVDRRSPATIPFT